ncbi:MAG: pilus assembly protein PilM [Lachnospiraceae bacterium]|nr:pilus assembly protein PilM [Lachnospiraceae bacterium]
MAKVLSIELGQSIVKMCEVDYKSKNPKVYSYMELETPQDAVIDGFVVRPDELAEVIVAAMGSHNIRTKKVVFTIASARIASREAFLPYVKKNKLGEMVQASAGDYFPVDISKAKVTYQILSTPTQEDGTKQYRLSLMVVPNDLLESYYTLAKFCGLDIVALDYAVNSIASAAKENLSNSVQMVVKIGEEVTQLFICSDGDMVLQRTMTNGMDVAIETMIDLSSRETGRTMSYTEVLGLMRSKPCVRISTDMTVFDKYDNSDVPENVRGEVTEALSPLSGSILRVIDYYNSRNSEKPIENIYLTGFAENFVGFAEYLSNEFGTEVKKLSEVCNINITESAGSYIACYGAAIDPLDMIPEARMSKKKKLSGGDSGSGKPEPNYIMIGAMVFGACVVVAAVLAVVSILPYRAAVKKKEELVKREAELEAIESVYKDNLKAVLVYDEVKKMYESTEHQNDNLIAFLEELEMKLPSTVNVLTFSADDERVSINMNVESKEAVALTIQELRGFTSLDTVTVAALSEEVDELGLNSVVNFTAECTYAPIVREDAQVQAQ